MLRGPLAVVIGDGSDAVHISRQATALRFKRSAFGGDLDLTCTARVPRALLRNLGPNCTLTVYDRRNGTPVFVGDLTNPGYTDGLSGQSLELQAFGRSVRLQAATTSLCYVDQTLDAWQRSANSTRDADTAQGERGEDNPTLEITAKTGSIGTDWQGEWINRALKRAGLRVGRVRADYDSGVTDSHYDLTVRTGTDNTSLPVRDTANASTTGGTLRATLDGAIDTGDTVASIRAARSTPGTTATKADWFRFANVTIRQVLKDVTGANILTGYSDNTINASDAIADMIGRGMAPGANPARVSITATDYEIDQLAWLDGITMADALQSLLVFEPDLYWTFYGDAFTAGLWADTTDARYVLTKRDGGISLPGQEDALCNRVAVTWTDRQKNDHTDIVTDAVPGLDFTRDAQAISLPPGTGSEANAQRAGLKALAITNNPPLAGTAVVRRKIRDLSTGFDVWPHEIRPGCIVMEAETGDRFRLTETEFNDDDGATTLTLGTPVRTIEQTLARLERKQRRRH